MAMGNIHIGTIAGKLNGVMPAQTPKGCRTLQLSTPPATFSEYSPLSSCDMPQAYSTTSRPRVIEPVASSMVLPCSAESSCANSSMFRLIKSRKANIT